MRTKLEEELGWWAARGLADGEAGVVTELREGPVVSTLLEAAQQAGSDLIVMGSHGKGGFERLALGSVTEKVLRRASCPVLVIPATEGTGVRVAPLRRVVCATDFSTPAARAVDFARTFADAAHAPLSLLSVVEWPFGETAGGDPVSQLRRSLHQEATEQLNTLARRGGGNPPAEIVVREGKPAREILAFAAEVQADLVVLGVSGRGAVDLAVLGSTAHQVLREASCPVLAVPAAGVS
jgi:nucleotide-binding universal stress UspA family protein